MTKREIEIEREPPDDDREDLDDHWTAFEDQILEYSITRTEVATAEELQELMPTEWLAGKYAGCLAEPPLPFPGETQEDANDRADRNAKRLDSAVQDCANAFHRLDPGAQLDIAVRAQPRDDDRYADILRRRSRHAS